MLAALQPSLLEWRGVDVREAPPATKQLRPYQLQATAGIREQLAAAQSTLVVMPTGTGKTVVAAHAAMAATGRVIFVVHLDTLVRQSKAELESITGQPWDVEQGDEWASVRGGRNLVASIQSLMRPGRFDRFAADAFALVITDEAHHYVSPSFVKPLRYYMQGGAKLLGFTATPDRRDGKALGRLFLTVAHRMDLADAIEEAWLSPVWCDPVKADVSLDHVKVSKATGDFDQEQLDEELAKIVAPIVKVAQEKCGDGRTIVFTPGVKAAHVAAQALNEVRAGCAMSIDGSMPALVKARTIRAHKAGEFQFLVNCGVLVEGYDDAKVTHMIDAAPTKSRSRCAQKVGRGTRLWPGIGELPTAEERHAAIAVSPKPRFRWIDIAFNGRHELASPADLLGGRYTDKERAKAKKILAAKGGDVRAALEEARKRLAEAANKAKVRLEAGGGFDPTKRRGRRASGEPKVDPKTIPATAKQRQLTVRKFGFELPADVTSFDAQKLIAKEFLCEQRGWCGYERRVKLGRYGINAWAMPVDTGRRLWAALKENGWRRLSPAQYQAAMTRREPGEDG